MTIDYSEFEKYANEFATAYNVYALESAELAFQTMGNYLLGEIPEYPNETTERLMPPDGVSYLRTDAQRRWFFAAVRAGDLPGWTWVDATYSTTSYYTQDSRSSGHGYSYKPVEHQVKKIVTPGHPQKTGGARTGNLGRAKAMDVSSDSHSAELQIGFDAALAPYAPWVVGDDFPGEEINGVQMYQARVNSGRWWQFGVIIDSKEEQGWELFYETFWQAFSERIK